MGESSTTATGNSAAISGIGSDGPPSDYDGNDNLTFDVPTGAMMTSNGVNMWKYQIAIQDFDDYANGYLTATSSEDKDGGDGSGSDYFEFTMQSVVVVTQN